MKITAPYQEKEKTFTYSSKDCVERGGYISNDKKIDEFIRSGLALVQMRRGSGEYDIPEEESDFEEDSDEYLSELTKQAEDFEQPPLLQHLDKITAVEVLDSAEKSFEQQQNILKESKKKTNSDSDSDKIVKAISKGFEEVSRKSKAEDEPKN